MEAHSHAPHPLLDTSFRESCTDPPLSRCPTKGHLFRVHVETGCFHRLRCKTNRCAFCAPRDGYGIAAAVAMAAPSVLVTITQVREEWSETQRLFRNLRTSLARAGHALEWMYTVEPSPRGTTLPHAHVLVHGERLPSPREWDRFARRTGFGHTRVDAVTTPHAAHYVLKNVTDLRTMPASTARTQLDEHLRLNGGRLIHATRCFWRDRHGAPLHGMQGAARLAGRDAGPREPDQWIVMGERNMRRLLDEP